MKTTSFFILTVIIILSGCNTQTSGEKPTGKFEILNLSEILKTPGNFENKKVSIKGLCIHTCRKSGKKLFLQGNSEEEFLKVTANGDISTFDNSLEGEELVVTGTLRIENEGDVIHQDTEHNESCASEQKTQNYTLECNTVKLVKNLK